MFKNMQRLTPIVALIFALILGACSSPQGKMIVSVREQRMLLLDEENRPVRLYPISTSKFGLGNDRGSNRTPLGKMSIARKIGDGLPSGAVLKGRRFTGEVLATDAPGRDPIVSRILWLKGEEPHNRNTYGRFIYIHGTPEERNIGRPASYGCIRMRSDDVIDLYNRVDNGAELLITTAPLPRTKVARLEKPALFNAARLVGLGRDKSVPNAPAPGEEAGFANANAEWGMSQSEKERYRSLQKLQQGG
jgi:hypothetical protein